MLQKKYKFNQSSVSIEIIGLPDFSNNDGENSISIISQWRLSILNHPDIEGSADHLKSIIKAFYDYSILVLLDQEKLIENKLIDIKPNNDGGHIVVLKSSKPEVKPLKMFLGNAEFSDIINCIDQIKESKNINLNFDKLTPAITYKKLYFKNKNISYSAFVPAILAVFSITILSLISINFYEKTDNLEDKVSFDIKTTNWQKN
tara:strand:- start:1418 stop:2026 length:609 start_codon:yes stop_codon:yes gene_type:complete